MEPASPPGGRPRQTRPPLPAARWWRRRWRTQWCTAAGSGLQADGADKLCCDTTNQQAGDVTAQATAAHSVRLQLPEGMSLGTSNSRLQAGTPTWRQLELPQPGAGLELEVSQVGHDQGVHQGGRRGRRRQRQQLQLHAARVDLRGRGRRAGLSACRPGSQCRGHGLCMRMGRQAVAWKLLNQRITTSHSLTPPHVSLCARPPGPAAWPAAMQGPGTCQ